MPILKVEVVDSPGWKRPDALADRIANAVARALGSGPHTVWVHVSMIARDDYAENEGTPSGAAPVFVTLIEREPPRAEALAAEVAALTKAIATACARSEDDVHLLYEPPAVGRIAFGGRLLT